MSANMLADFSPSPGSEDICANTRACAPNSRGHMKTQSPCRGCPGTLLVRNRRIDANACRWQWQASQAAWSSLQKTPTIVPLDELDANLDSNSDNISEFCILAAARDKPIVEAL